MTVIELIRELQKCNPELEVIIHEDCAIVDVDQVERIKYKGPYDRAIALRTNYVQLTAGCLCGYSL